VGARGSGEPTLRSSLARNGPAPIHRSHPRRPQAKLADFGLHKRVRAILKSGLALPWAQDVSLQGDACEKSFYGGNMYAGASAGAGAARGAFASSLYAAGGSLHGGARAAAAGADAGGLPLAASYSNLSALGRVHENEEGTVAAGAGARTGAAGAPAAQPLPRPGSYRDLAAGADIATRVLSSSGVGDASGHGSRSAHAGAGAGGAGGPSRASTGSATGGGAGGGDVSVHRRLAAVQALEGSVRAGSVFPSLTGALPAGASPASSGRGGTGSRGGDSSEIEVLVEDARPSGAGARWGKAGAGAGFGSGRAGGGSARGGQLGSQRGVLVDATQKVGVEGGWMGRCSFGHAACSPALVAPSHMKPLAEGARGPLGLAGFACCALLGRGGHTSSMAVEGGTGDI
jgi:hypothetical protein